MPPKLHPNDINSVQAFQEIKESVAIVSWRKNRSSETTHGAGVILKEEGILVTNYHVIEGADDSEIRVTTIDKRTHRKVQVLDKDRDWDLAVLKVKAPRKKLRPISVGDSDNLFVGQTVYVAGHPHDLEFSCTDGLISGVERTVESSATEVDKKGWIQINVCINSGSSGGPVVDRWIKLIGIISGDSSPGHTFAIPVKVAKLEHDDHSHSNHEEAIRKLERQLERSKRDQIIDPELYDAVRFGSPHDFVSALKKLCLDHEDCLASHIMNQVSSTGDTLLNMAIESGNIETGVLISSHFPSLARKRNNNGDTILHVAARSLRNST